jgi:hypothetical protein
LPRAGWAVWRTRRYREHLQRGLSQFGSMLCWFLAVSVLSLGMAGALENLRMLDCTTIIARSHCSRLLANLGAERLGGREPRADRRSFQIDSHRAKSRFS